MKKFTKSIVTLCAIASAVPVFSQTFRKGDIVVDLGVGIGVAEVTDTRYTSNSKSEVKTDDKMGVTFTQQLGVEIGVFNFNEKSSLGFGVNVNNSWGATHQSIVTGNYDYTYTIHEYRRSTGTFSRWQSAGYSTGERRGSGTAQARTCLDELNIMFKLAYHYEAIKNLDLYGALGFGISSYRELYSDYTNKSGFSNLSNKLDESSKLNYQAVYSFNDLDHVVWQNSVPSARFVLGAYVGMRYYFNDHWGVYGQVGLPSLSFKKDLNNYSIFNCGVSYKF